MDDKLIIIAITVCLFAIIYSIINLIEIHIKNMIRKIKIERYKKYRSILFDFAYTTMMSIMCRKEYADNNDFVYIGRLWSIVLLGEEERDMHYFELFPIIYDYSDEIKHIMFFKRNIDDLEIFVDDSNDINIKNLLFSITRENGKFNLFVNDQENETIYCNSYCKELKSIATELERIKNTNTILVDYNINITNM